MPTITIVNDTSEVVHIAIYWKPVKQPSLATCAWKIVTPPPDGGQTVVQIPAEYGAYANFSSDVAEPKDPNAGSRTRVIEFDETTARFIISADLQNRQGVAATITQSFTDLLPNEVRIENLFAYGVWGHITKDHNDVYAPQVISPGGVLVEDVRSGFYLAVVSQFVTKGDLLVDEEISITETEPLLGGTAVVTGSIWKGFAIAAAPSTSPAVQNSEEGG